MIIGHLGVAYAVRARWSRIGLGVLLLATMMPDLARGWLGVGGFDSWRMTLYTHVMPWCLAIALGMAVLYWLATRNTLGAAIVGAVVLSHIALDMISGRKPLSMTGPFGLGLGQYQQLEFVIEAAILIVGWRFLRRREPLRWATSRTVLAALLIFEGLFLAKQLSDRPYATRCIEYPIRPCWIRRGDKIHP